MCCIACKAQQDKTSGHAAISMQAEGIAQAATESLEAAMPLLPHACAVMATCMCSMV